MWTFIKKDLIIKVLGEKAGFTCCEMVQVVRVETVDNGMHVLYCYKLLKFYCNM